MGRRARSNRWPLTMFTVRVAPHRVARWAIPAGTWELPAADAEHARQLGAREAHRLAGVPPWRPFVNESMDHATATGPRMVVA